MKMLIFGACIFIFMDYGFAQKGDQLAIHLSKKGVQELLQKTIEKVEIGDKNNLEIILHNTQSTSSVELESLEGVGKEVVNAFTPFDLEKPFLNLLYEIPEIKLNSNLSDYEFEPVIENGKQFIKARVNLINTSVKIPKVKICDEKEKVKQYSQQVQKYIYVCKEGQYSEVEDIILIQKNKPLSFEAKFEVNLNEIEEKIKLISLTSNIDENAGNEFIDLANFSVASIEDEEMKFSKELKQAKQVKESISYSLADEFEQVILNKDIFNELFSGVVESLEGNAKQEGIIAQNLKGIINPAVSELFGKLNNLLEKQGTSLTENIELVAEESRPMTLTDVFDGVKADSASVQKEIEHKLALKGGAKLSLGEMFSQILDEVNGLKVNLKKTSIESHTGDDLTFYYDVDIIARDNNFEKNEEFINDVDYIKESGRPLEDIDFKHCGSEYDLAISVSEPAINSVLSMAEDLDIFNALVKNNSFGEELSINGAKAYFVAANESDNELARIDVVAEVEILMSEKSGIGAWVERNFNGDGYRLSGEGRWWQIKGIAKNVQALFNSGWKKEQVLKDAKEYTELGNYLRDEAVTFRFPLEIQLEIHETKNGQVLKPRTPFDKNGDFKNTHNNPHTNLYKKNSYLVGKIKESIKEKFEKVDGFGKPAGLGKEFPLDLNFIKENTNDKLSGESIHIHDSGHLIINFNINEDKLFAPNEEGEVK